MLLLTMYDTDPTANLFVPNPHPLWNEVQEELTKLDDLVQDGHDETGELELISARLRTLLADMAEQ